MSKSRKCILKCAEVSHTYGFPRDEIGRKIWLKQLGLKDANKSAVVCDRHFSKLMRPHGFSNKITSSAIPDINLPKHFDDDDEFSEEDYLEEEEGREISENIVNGFAQNNKIEEGTFTASAQELNSHSVKESMNFSEPLDFEDMIDSQNNYNNNNNNNSNKESTIIDRQIEEFFEEVEEEQFLEEPENSNTPSLVIENGHDFSDEDTFSVAQDVVEINNRFKRKLIACVRRRRILYDPAHPYFGNIEQKTMAWERIGKIQKVDASTCRELWLNLRYNYQNHVRSLRQWLAGESNQHERPRIQFENDLIFLWRFIPDNSTCGVEIDEVCSPPLAHIPNSIKESEKPEQELEEMDIDKPQHFVANLIEAVRSYPEMYDTKHANYGNAKRRSTIWEAISTEVREKATKCMFTWIQLMLRYEFEYTHIKHLGSYLLTKMRFLEKHIVVNEKSPFKRTTWLRDSWVDPLYSTEEQHMLIAGMITSKKLRPYFANIDCPFATNDLLKVPHMHIVAKAKKIMPAQCEITWIIIQIMYCELSEFRRNKCRLRDEWELESIITNLRDTLAKSRPKGYKLQSQPELLPPPLSENCKETFDSNSNLENVEEMDIITDEDSQYPCQTAEEPRPSTPSPPEQPPPAPEQKNEIIFKVPGKNPGDEEQVVHYALDTPLSELPESVVIDINSVLENAHIVIITRYKTESKVSLFTLEKRKELIGEVMARPIIFNEPCKTSRISRLFMSEIATDIGYPVEACLSFWEYIVEKSFFVDYDPSWKKSKEQKWIPAPYPIFDKFQRYAESKNWNESISVLADFMQEIGNFPLIYSDLKINSSWNRRQCYIRDISEVWAILARKFVVLENHKLIWDKFKQIFMLYMSEIELSMYNPWPAFWAPVFAKMKFLLDYKYKPKDPIYYVLRYKINEEVNLCKTKGGAIMGQLDAVTNAKIIFRLLKENEYLEDFTWVNRSRFISKMKSFPELYDINHPQFGNKEAKLDAWQEMALLFHCTVGECHLIFQHLMKSFLIFRARDPNQLCQVNAKYWENMTYIYSCAVPNVIDSKSISGRSFRTSSNGSTIKLAEEYQAEISLVDAKPRLILKNFASAINTLPVQLQSTVTQNLNYIFSEYTRFQNEEIVVDV